MNKKPLTSSSLLTLILTFVNVSVGFFQFQPSIVIPEKSPTILLEHLKGASEGDRYCFELLAEGRQLSDESIQRSYQLSNRTACQEKCRKSLGNSFTCNFYSFGYLSENKKNGRCYLTSQTIKNQLQTQSNSEFSVYSRVSYCKKRPGSRSLERTRTHRRDDHRDDDVVRVGDDVTVGEQERFLLSQFSAPVNGVCFRLSVSSRRLADRFIKKSETAYSLEQCKEFCATETDFICKGFAYRRPLSQGEILNCDLTSVDPGTLDKYNNYDFYESSVTDFFERGGLIGADGVTCIFDRAKDMDCFKRIRASHKHFTYRNYKTAVSLARCADECIKTSYCKTFSFYAGGGNSVPGNCLLSEKDLSRLDSQGFVDLVSAARDDSVRNWDVYETRSLDGRNCYDDIDRDEGQNDDCFRREMAAYKHKIDRGDDDGDDDDGTLIAIKVHSLDECAQKCGSSLMMGNCKTFSYNLYPKISSSENRNSVKNCILSSLTPAELNTDKDNNNNYNADYDDNWNIYRHLMDDECQNNNDMKTISTVATSVTTSISDIVPNNPKRDVNDCYRRKRVGFKHYFTAVIETLTAGSVSTCSDFCQSDPRCKSFSFKFNTRSSSSSSSGNCLLSGLTVQKVIEAERLEPDTEWDLYESTSNCQIGSVKFANAECERLYHAGVKHHSSTIRNIFNSGDVHDCSRRCRMTSGCKTFSYRSTSAVANCVISDFSVRELLSSGRVLLLDRLWDFYESLSQDQQGQDCGYHHHQWPQGGHIQDCYQIHRTESIHYKSLIERTHSVVSLTECAEKCGYSKVKCGSFSYRSTGLASANCVLSGIEAGDISDFSDLSHNPQWDVFTFDRRKAQCQMSSQDDDDDDDHDDLAEDCFERNQRGYRFMSSRVRDGFKVRNAFECSEECKRSSRFRCKSFAFKADYLQYDNCLLSELDVRELDAYSDLVVDSIWSVFDQRDTGYCRQGGGDYFDNGNNNGNQNEEDCYQLERRGSKFYHLAVSSSLFVRSLDECSRACHRVAVCRSFSFNGGRFASEDNCQLSVLSPNSIVSSDIEDEPRWNLYAKQFGGGSFCENGPSGGGAGGGTPIGGDDEGDCYRLDRSGYRHEGRRSVSKEISVRSKVECAAECRRTGYCLSFSYEYFARSSSLNCVLSAKDVRLLSAEDLAADSNWDVYEFRDDLRECRRDPFGVGGPGGVTGVGDKDACIDMVKSGFVHRPAFIIAKRDAKNSVECERFCRQLTSCTSFSYRTGFNTRDNCLLSDSGLSVTSDLESGSYWAVYRLRFDGQCREQQQDNADNVQRDCFRLFEADFRITDEAVNERVVAFDVADCQLACTDNGFRQDYQCRSFAFTDDKEALDKGNCHLSSQDPRDSGFRRFIIRNIGYNLYERRSSSFCNNDKFSTQTSCSSEYRMQSRLVFQRVQIEIDADDLSDCERSCVQEDRFICTGFSFKRSSSIGYKNCELTDKRFAELSNSFDLGFAEDWDTFERVRFSGAECRGQTADFDRNEISSPGLFSRLDCYDRNFEHFSLRSRIVVEYVRVTDEEECAFECDRHREHQRGSFGCNAFAFRRYSGSGDNCYLSDLYGRNIDHQLRREPDSHVWEYRGGGGSTGSCRRRSDTFTVTGKRCQRGSQLNTEVRYWYCPVEGEPGWDYCCRPGSHCGYSEGYDYPWCYVGEEGYDQWRPCSIEVYGKKSDHLLASEPLRENPTLDKEAPDINLESTFNPRNPLNVTNSLSYQEHLDKDNNNEGHEEEEAKEMTQSDDMKRQPKSL